MTPEFEAKTNIFNKYFASHCTIINNNGVLPSTLNYLNDDELSSFNISSEVIFQLIEFFSKNLDPNKAHRYDEISVKMLKLCAPNMQTTYFSLPELFCLWRIYNVRKKVILFQSERR